MKMAIVFDPDPQLGPDLLDPAKEDRRLGEFIDSSSSDVFLMVRRYGEQYEDGARTDIWSSGAWENVSSKTIKKVIRKLGEL
jgi:hypothetical protein